MALTADSTKLMLYDFETKQWRVLAAGSLFENPEWSKDDEILYWIDAPSNTVVRIRRSTGTIDTVADLKPERLALTGAGVWTGLAPDGSLLAIRDLSTQEIYSADLLRQ